MPRAAVVTVLLLLLAATTPRTLGATPAGRAALETRALAWIDRKAWRFEAADPVHGGADLDPVVAALGAARVVGIGETTHGTSEFFAFKGALIRRLIETGGLDAVTVESGFTESRALNDYVLRGVGDPTRLIRDPGVYQIWQCEEFLSLLTWVRAWNLSHERKVSFLGYDIMRPGVAITSALAWLEARDPVAARALRGRLGPILTDARRRANPLNYMGELKVADAAQLADAAGDLVAAVGRARAGDDADNQAFARQSAETARQILSVWVAPAGIAPSANAGERVQLNDVIRSRDRFMADNIGWISRRHPGGRIAVWAHDSHVSRHGFDFTRSMGSFLAEAFGPAYRVVGFAWSRGAFNSQTTSRPEGGTTADATLRTFRIERPVPGSIGALLARTRADRLAIDLRDAPPTLRRWRDTIRYRRMEAGSGYVPGAMAEAKPAPLGDAYDILIWFRTTHASRLLPYVDRGAMLP